MPDFEEKKTDQKEQLTGEEALRVMLVREETDRKAIERAVAPLDGSLRVGSPCDVEFGAATAFVGSGPIRIEGQWRRCQVLSHEGAIVHVRLWPAG